MCDATCVWMCVQLCWYFVDKCKEKKPRSVIPESTTVDGRFTSGWCWPCQREDTVPVNAIVRLNSWSFNPRLNWLAQFITKCVYIYIYTHIYIYLTVLQEYIYSVTCVWECVCVCVCLCVRACVRACVRVCVINRQCTRPALFIIYLCVFCSWP